MWQTHFRKYKVILKGWKSFFIIFVLFLASGSGSESTFPIQIRIHIQESQINADPMWIRNTDLKLLCTFTTLYVRVPIPGYEKLNFFCRTKKSDIFNSLYWA